jgi:hypothetical protein
VAFDVSGSVGAAEDGGLDVRVDLTNRGPGAAAPLTLRAELGGARDEARLEGETPAGVTRSLAFRFEDLPAEPGVHPLALRLEFAAAAKPSEALSQAAYLLVALGANPPPAVRLTVPPVALRDRDALKVGVESLDGAAHRVRLSVITPRGINPEPPEVEASIPATGTVEVALPLLRAGAPRPSRQGVVVTAQTMDEGPRRTSVATGTVAVAPDPARLPRLRPWLIGAAVLMLLAAALQEWWSSRGGAARGPDAPGPGAPGPQASGPDAA